MKNKFIALAAALLALTAVSVFLSRRKPPEPVWQGRTLSAWTDDLVNGSSKEVREPAEEAIRAIGPSAIPSLLRMMRARDSFSKRAAAWLNRHQNAIQFSIVWARQEHVRAWLAFGALGTDAEPAIPELGRLLINGHEAEFVPEALASISPKCVPVLLDAVPRVESGRRCRILRAAFKWPSEERLIVSALEKSLRDAHREVRMCAATLLARCRADPARTVQLLVSALDDPEVAVRVQAVGSLGEFGTNASLVVPVLRKLSINSDSLIGLAVSNALRRIESPVR